jgi:biopolymer transport protein ExbD
MAVSIKTQDVEDENGQYRPMAEINITPFVDVMLVLLVIFMVAAPLMVAGVPVDLPQTSATRLSQPKKPMVVTLTPDGHYQIREEIIERAQLVSRLLALKAEEGDTVVYVRADRKAGYGEVMELLGRVGESGYQRISLLTQPAPGTASPAAAPAQPAPGN